MASRAERTQLNLIFAGCDAGIHTLPQPLLDARGRMTGIEAGANALAEPDDDEHAAFGRLSSQLVAGGDLDLEPIFAARAARERYDLSRRAYIQAAERAGDEMVSAVHDLADEIVHEHLAPAQAAIITATRSAHDTFSPHGSTPAELMSAPRPARDAYTRVDGLVRDFATLRQAVARVRQLTGGVPQNDTRGLFGVIKNCDEVWPAVLRNMNVASNGSQPPWPNDEAGYLLYLSRPDVQAWCPTVAEQDARWYEVFGAKVEQDRRNRASLNAYASALGPNQKTSGLVSMPGPSGTAA